METSSSGKLGRAGLIIGIAVFIFLALFFNPVPENPAIGLTAAVAALMAVWWITEAIPLAITSLLPMAFFPLLGIMDGKDVATTYFNHVIFLFIGGFIIALAMERWELHRRIALVTLGLFGVRPEMIMLGFMVTTAFISMWISNTATAMMMVPIGMAVLKNLETQVDKVTLGKYSIGLLIGIAYSASIGGIATLVGTPPNLSLVRIYAIIYPQAPEISFASWFFFAAPFAFIFLLISWMLLTLMFVRKQFRIDKDTVKNQYRALGKMSFEEKAVLAAFVMVALLWLTRERIEMGTFILPGWSGLFKSPSYLNDGVVAIAVALVLYIIPSKKGGAIMDWENTARLPWNIVLLFGGGFALATGFVTSGLSVWFGNLFAGISGTPTIFIIAGLSTMVTFLTEMTSNTATAEMILPVLASLANAIGEHPLLLMVPAAISASCAFMMPVATPPNAIIFGTNRVRIIDMVKVGIIMNLIGVILITSLVILSGSILGIQPGELPAWMAHP